MKTEEEIKAKLKELENQGSLSANMNYETAGAREALEWVLELSKYLTAGRR